MIWISTSIGYSIKTGWFFFLLVLSHLLCLYSGCCFLFSHSIIRFFIRRKHTTNRHCHVFFRMNFRTKRNQRLVFKHTSQFAINTISEHIAKSIKFLFVFQLKFSAENESSVEPRWYNCFRFYRIQFLFPAIKITFLGNIVWNECLRR